MSFLKLQVRPPQSLTISKSNVHIPLDVYELLGKPDRVDLYYDVERKAIQVIPVEKGMFRVVRATKSDRYYRISSTISKFLDQGVYAYTEPQTKESDDYIFDYLMPSIRRKEHL